jgi:hypothetical protein
MRVRAIGHSSSSRQTLAPITKIRTGGVVNGWPESTWRKKSRCTAVMSSASWLAPSPNCTSPTTSWGLPCAHGPTSSRWPFRAASVAARSRRPAKLRRVPSMKMSLQPPMCSAGTCTCS